MLFPKRERCYWYWRETGEISQADGKPIVEIVDGCGIRPAIALTESTSVRHAARICNTLNRLDGRTDAPTFDETTGRAIEL